MRIISGSHRGIKLRFNNNLNVRPTTDKAKEALFNILNHRYQLQTKIVWTCFLEQVIFLLNFVLEGVTK